MCVSAQANHVALSKEASEVQSLLPFLLFAMEEPSAGILVGWQQCAVNNHEGISCLLCFLQQSLYLLIVRLVEVHHYIGILPYPEGEGGLLYLLTQFC